MFNFFKKQNIDTTSENDIVSINFSVDPHNTVNVYVDWISDEPTIAKTLAVLLFNINNGLYSDKLINMFSDKIKNNEDKDFILKILQEWRSINDVAEHTLNTTDKYPLIRPMSFSQNVKN